MLIEKTISLPHSSVDKAVLNHSKFEQMFLQNNGQDSNKRFISNELFVCKAKDKYVSTITYSTLTCH